MVSETREVLGMDRFSHKISAHGHVNGYQLKKEIHVACCWKECGEKGIFVHCLWESKLL